MDCSTARLLLEIERPRLAELDSAEAAALERHLAECPECSRIARAARVTRERFGVAMRAVPVPAGLRERVLARLDTEARNRGRKSWLRSRWSAVAAAVLFVVALGFLWQFRQ